MKIGIVILSRYTSTRFPGKALYELNGNTLLGHIVDNFKLKLPKINRVVATSDNPSDDCIIKFCEQKGYDYWRGSLENVSQRVLDCSINYNWEYFVRINGDNLFNDPTILMELLKDIDIGKYDFISNVEGRTFPYGMSIEIVKVSFYKKIFKYFENINHKEHVTSWLYENPSFGNRFYFYNKKYKNIIGVKLSIDTKIDIDLAEKIINYNGGKSNVPLNVLNQFFEKTRHKNFNINDK